MPDEFRAVFGRRGYATPSLFVVEFVHIPAVMTDIRGVAEILRDLRMFAETAEVPGTQILTQEHRFYDLQQKYAYAKAHDDLNITFRLDSDHLVRRMFDLWIDSIYDKRTGNVRYKNDYTGTLRIHQMRLDGTKAYSVEVQECFPTTIGQTSLGWDQAGTITRLPVTFSFRRLQNIPSEEGKVQISEPKATIQRTPADSGAVRQYRINDREGFTNILTTRQE